MLRSIAGAIFGLHCQLGERVTQSRTACEIRMWRMRSRLACVDVDVQEIQ
jgi:hypothetical protein